MFHCLVIKVVSLSFLCDSLFILPHLFLFVKNFFKFFQNFFNDFCDSLLISNSFTLSHSFLNVKYFFEVFYFFQNSKLQTEKEGFEPSRRLPDLYP